MTTRSRPSNRPLSREWTYLFTQNHRDALFFWNDTWLPQTVPTGAHVQIQLPGDPIRWVPDRDCTPTGAAALLPRARAELLGSNTLQNEGRVPGASRLHVFDYRITGTGAVAICLSPDPVPESPEQLGFPPGSPLDYTLTLLAGVPQINVP